MSGHCLVRDVKQEKCARPEHVFETTRPANALSFHRSSNATSISALRAWRTFHIAVLKSSSFDLCGLSGSDSPEAADAFPPRRISYAREIEWNCDWAFSGGSVRAKGESGW